MRELRLRNRPGLGQLGHGVAGEDETRLISCALESGTREGARQQRRQQALDRLEARFFRFGRHFRFSRVFLTTAMERRSAESFKRPGGALSVLQLSEGRAGA